MKSGGAAPMQFRLCAKVSSSRLYGPERSLHEDSASHLWPCRSSLPHRSHHRLLGDPMSYSSDDLSVFNLLRDARELEGTAYFELHPHDLPEQHGCWLEGSLFVQDAGFDFFTGCCHRVHPEFDYFAFVRFDRAQIQALGAE